ncbi:cell division protein [Agaricicola taiwanensis]|uniref:Cell division protein n=2 Tax=Agaricicola taiwanensis TaxID=591372 RepID=A0A8J3DX03_9RHOB|nr:cell division protein [Agaricicola taiwanensis]
MATLASMAYFAHHAVSGNRGIVAKRAYEAEMKALEADLKKVKAERTALEKRVAALRPTQVERDMLDQLARERLGYMHPDERVLEKQ